MNKKVVVLSALFGVILILVIVVAIWPPYLDTVNGYRPFSPGTYDVPLIIGGEYGVFLVAWQDGWLYWPCAYHRSTLDDRPIGTGWLQTQPITLTFF